MRIGTGDKAVEFKPTVVDTGSTGFLLSAKQYPGWTKEMAEKCDKGWEFLSSSKNLYSGRWIPTNITFLNTSVPVTAMVPILAVEEKTNCPKYNKTSGRGVCVSVAGDDPPKPTLMPSGIRYMGIGFGREHDGMPQGTPDKNAFLNIQKIGNETIQGNANYRSGFIIGKEGITVGLTSNNTDGMNFASLEKRKDSTDKRDWNQSPGCVKIDDAKQYTRLIVLVDTGVEQAYITLPKSTSVNLTMESNLADKSRVYWEVGNAGSKSILSSSWTVGNKEEAEKGVGTASVKVTLSDKIAPKLNTGRHLFRQWKLAFDADGGLFGAAKVK